MILVVAGLLLLFMDTFRPGRRTTIAVHIGAALVHAWVAWVFADHRAWPGFVLFSAIATVLGVMPFVERPASKDEAPEPAIDLLTLIMTTMTLVVGLAILGLPTQMITVSQISPPQAKWPADPAAQTALVDSRPWDSTYGLGHGAVGKANAEAWKAGTSRRRQTPEPCRLGSR